MTLDELYTAIIGATFDAERLERTGDVRLASAAYVKVSDLEEQIADLLPATDPEGAIARRGVITAALSAGEVTRALQQALTYADDRDTLSRLRADLEHLRDLAELRLRRLVGGPPTVVPVGFTLPEAA